MSVCKREQKREEGRKRESLRRKLSICLNRVCVAWIVIIYLRRVCCMVLTSAWQRDRCNLWCSSIIDDFVSLSFFFLIHGSFALIFISFLIFDLLNSCTIIIGVVIIFRWSNVLYYLRYTNFRDSSIFWIKITLHRDEEKKKIRGVNFVNWRSFKTNKRVILFCRELVSRSRNLNQFTILTPFLS